MCPWWTLEGRFLILFGFYKKDDTVRIENVEDSFYSLRYGAPAVVVVDVEAAGNKGEVVKVGGVDADGVQLCPRIDTVGGFAVTRAGGNKSGEFVTADFDGTGVADGAAVLAVCQKPQVRRRGRLLSLPAAQWKLLRLHFPSTENR